MQYTEMRENELNAMLAPDGPLRRAVYAIVLKLRYASTSKETEDLTKELDTAIDDYAKHAVELDRLKRS